jgi:hypothetical protein
VLLGPVEGRVNHLAGREALVVGVADGATDGDLAADAVNGDPGDLVGLVAHVGVGQVHAVQPVHVQLPAEAGLTPNKVSAHPQSAENLIVIELTFPR